MSGGQIETDCTPRQQASVTISTHLLNSITDRHRLELQTEVHPKVSNQFTEKAATRTFLNVKTLLVGAFNQKKALVGSFSVIVFANLRLKL